MVFFISLNLRLIKIKQYCIQKRNLYCTTKFIGIVYHVVNQLSNF